MKCGHNDCFTCPYPDCIMDKYDRSEIYMAPIPEKTALSKAEKQNSYNAKHYDGTNANELEFVFEEEAFESWLQKACAGKRAKYTPATSHAIYSRTERFFKECAVLTVENLHNMIEQWSDVGRESAYINSIINGLRAYMNFLSQKYGNPLLGKLKLAKSCTIPKKQFVDNVITRANYDYLIAESKKDTKTPNVYIACRIMGTTGVRISELFQIKVEDIKLGYLDILGKGRKVRRIYFPKGAKEELLEYFHALGVDSGYCVRRWKTDKKEFSGNTRDCGNFNETLSFKRLLYSQLQAAGQKYGIPAELMHAHGFRHFFAKEFLAHRLDISLLADLLGHSSLEITRIYLRMTSREQAQIVDDTVTW